MRLAGLPALGIRFAVRRSNLADKWRSANGLVMTQLLLKSAAAAALESSGSFSLAASFKRAA